MAPVLLSPKNRQPHQTELKSTIAAVLNLLEDQHILHGLVFSLSFLSISSPRPFQLSWRADEKKEN